MASVNKVILVGNLGRDPEVRHMPNGDKVCNFSIATTDTWKDKSGVKQERTEWHNIVMYRKLAEIAGEYLKKGRPVYIEGSLQTSKWEKDGIIRYRTEIIANQMQMLGSRSGSNNVHETGTNENTEQDAPPPANSGGGFEDDIPFAPSHKGNEYIV